MLVDETDSVFHDFSSSQTLSFFVAANMLVMYDAMTNDAS